MLHMLVELPGLAPTIDSTIQRSRGISWSDCSCWALFNNSEGRPTSLISSFDFGLLQRGCQILQVSEDSTNRSRGQQRFSMRIFLIKRISKLQDQSFGVLAMPLCCFAILRALVKVRRYYLDSPCKYRGFENFHDGKSLLSSISGVFPSPLCQDYLPLHRPGQPLERPVGAR